MREPLAAILRRTADPGTAAVVVPETPMASPRDEAAAGDADADITEGLRVAVRVMLARFSGLQEADAKDLAQELAVEYWLHRDTVQAPAGWFRACAIRKAQRFLSRRNYDDALDSAANASGPCFEPREQALQQIYFTMQNRCRRLLGLVVIAGCRPDEVAIGSGRTARSVYQNTARCLKTLRARWLRFSELQATRGQAAT